MVAVFKHPYSVERSVLECFLEVCPSLQELSNRLYVLIVFHDGYRGGIGFPSVDRIEQLFEGRTSYER
jgi:hypothetical protein